jgi:mannose-6-phosphate isomerase-like protein (cupin superfamily)
MVQCFEIGAFTINFIRMANPEKKNFDTSDETKTSPNAKIDVVKVGGKTVTRSTFQPGWKWSKDIGPLAGSDACQAHHFVYIESGTMHVVAGDGTEVEMEAGDIVDIPPGHDAWVLDNDPVVLIDFGENIK